MNFFNNLRTKLLISFALILIIPSFSIGLLAYNSAKNAVEFEMMDAAKQNINLLNSLIDSTIYPKINDMNVFSETITASLYEEDASPELRTQFAQYATLHPEATSIFVGTEEDGLFIQEPRVAMDPDYDPRVRAWYSEAMQQKGEIIISEPYIAAGTDDMVITVSKAIQDGSGVVAVSVHLSHLQELTNSVEIGDEGYAILLDKNQKYISHPTIAGGTEASESFYEQMYVGDTGQFSYNLDGHLKHLTYVTNEVTGWKIGGTMFDEEIDMAASSIFNTTLIVIGIAIVFGGIVVFFIIRSIINPIKSLKDTAITVSQGNLSEKIMVHSNDEIGQLGAAFNEMQSNLRTLIQQVDSSADQVAASAEELTASAEETSTATSQVASSIQSVASSAEAQTTGLDKNSQSLDELSIGVARIAESSSNVAELTQNTTMQAEDGNKALQNTITQMNSIQESVSESNVMIQSLSDRSKEISTILDVITGIAEQTNLLALNAAIEAARAGEHGKGFAVVAAEVRKLAEQSQDSAKQIFDLIQGIQKDTETSVEKMSLVTSNVKDGMTISHEALAKFSEILSSMRAITPQVQEVSATAEQMAAGVQEVNSTANELAVIAKSNSATSEEVAASTEEQLASMEDIASSAKSLSEMAEELKLIISKFRY
ncbi:methyl-accepting chemotaxis protein [Alkalihalobacillus sp. MEB130]|uniref:methyl-accepting chemotaxis protein n=1 Tax=Alkalihalobacillus sp. MEB130 TaxID=2976704 RepID=UPI0028DF4A16|nr:methyl-accepting chemotaxis protein [Alkalihalobacillus sp. MEB130]MDT8862581.1 methyl-accepting chemotaxis protein [Alkalihalobacillus sp. MEB130]